MFSEQGEEQVMAANPSIEALQWRQGAAEAAEQFMLAPDDLGGECPEPAVAPPPPIAPAMTPAGANDAVYSVVPTPSAREARPQRDDADPPPPAQPRSRSPSRLATKSTPLRPSSA